MPTRDHPVRRSESGVPGIRLTLWIAGLIAIVVAVIMYNRQDSSVVEIVETLIKEETVIPEPEREVQSRVQRESGPVMSVLDDTPVAPEQPLPALNESDQEVLDALSGVTNSGSWLRWFQPEEMVRKLAVIVDSAARGEVARKDLALPKPGSAFKATEDDQRAWLDQSTYERYDAYINVLDAIDTDALAIVYRYYLPLFEEAYAELGYPDRTFEMSLQEAIEKILATPIITGEIELTGKSVAYEFADPELEALPPLAKQIIRMGPKNSEILMGKARELQASLARDSE
jgi:hypothetical protein